MTLNGAVGTSDAPAPDAAAVATPQAAVAPAGAPPRARFKFDNRFLAPILITCILVAGHFTYGILESPWKTAAAIAASIAIEMVLGRLIVGKWPHLASAYITGISVGILIRSNLLWPYVLCAAIAIVSKYAIRFRGRHLWNPSNLGVSAMLFLAPWAVASLSIQWGNEIWVMLIIWTLGSLIIGRLKRFHICATYVLAFLTLGFVRSAVTGHTYLAEIAPVTGPMYQLFVFFMITDPKTTVSSKRGQVLVAVLVAVAETAIRLLPEYHGLVGLTQRQATHGFALHAPYFALFVVGPLANLVELLVWPPPTRPAGGGFPVVTGPVGATR